MHHTTCYLDMVALTNSWKSPTASAKPVVKSSCSNPCDTLSELSNAPGQDLTIRIVTGSGFHLTKSIAVLPPYCSLLVSHGAVQLTSNPQRG